ncbi:MAG: hypothetical protein ABIP03_09690 [Aquihabitans sp.]
MTQTEVGAGAGARRSGAVGRRLLAMATFVLAVILPLLRQQGNRSWDSVWAEDGSVFYQQAIDSPGLRVLARGYNGYMVLPPRILSLPSPFIPLEHLALYFAISSAVVIALLAFFTYHSARGWIPSRAVRLALASFVVLMPAMGPENTSTVTNTIWSFAAVAPWAFVSLEERRGDVVARCLVVFFAVTGTVLGFVFIPLAIGWACIRKTRAAYAVLVAYLVGLTVQVLVMMSTASELIPVPPQRPVDDFVRLVGVRVFALYLVGQESAVSLWKANGPGAVFGATVIVVTIFAAAAWRTDRRHLLLGLTMAAYGLGSFLVLVFGRGTLLFRLTGTFDMFAAMRYSVPANLMLASGLAILLSGDRSRRWASGVRWAYVAHLSVLMVVCFSVTGYRALGPSWSEHLDVARKVCLMDPAPAKVEVPQDALSYSKIRVSCSRVLR